MNKLRKGLKAFGYMIWVTMFPVISAVVVVLKNIQSPKSMLVQGFFMLLCFGIGIWIIRKKQITLKALYLKNTKRGWMIYTPCLLILMPSAIGGFKCESLNYFIGTFFLYSMVGLTEELYFRCIMIETLKEAFDYKWVMLIATVLFGMGHMAVALSGTDFLYTLLVIVNALIFGFLANVLIRETKNIYGVMIIHFLFDFESKFVNIQENVLAIAEFLRGALMVIYIIVLLEMSRKNKGKITSKNKKCSI